MFYKRTDIQITSVQSIQLTKIENIIYNQVNTKSKYENMKMKMKSQSTSIFLLLRQINQHSHFLLKVFGVGYCGF